MKIVLRIFLFVIALNIASCSTDEVKNYTQYVDPFIGTGGHGHTFPGAMVPFGMVQLSPDTRMETGMAHRVTIIPIKLLWDSVIRI